MRNKLGGLILTIASGAASLNVYAATFHKDVLPILQKRCQSCHRPGEVAPMSLMTYQEVRPWAKAIRQAVLTRKMPPWFADPHVGRFANDATLSRDEMDTIGAWVDGGAQAGDINDAPQSVKFVDGWSIGKPETIWEMPTAFEIPPSGVLNYYYVIIPTGLTEDRWVQAAEVRPGNRAVLHHVIVYLREPGSRWLADGKPGVPFLPKGGSDGEPSDSLGGYAPGMVPMSLKPGRALLLKAGADLVFQLHYTPNGKTATDKTKVGVIFARKPPEKRVTTLASGTPFFKIPPGAPNHRVDASTKIAGDLELVDMMPHMHVRGKAFEFRVVHPDGTKEILLNVPHYDFNWQLTYVPEVPIPLHRGDKIETTAWYDNSANNPANPDPAKEITYGEQTWEEMMFGFFTVAMPLQKADHPDLKTDAPAVDQILNRYIEALGGKTAIQTPTSRLMTGSIQFPALDAQAVVRIYSKAPNKELVEIVSADLGNSRIGFDGVTAWEEVEANVSDLTDYPRRDADFYLPLKLRELYPRIESKGQQKIGNREGWLLEAPRGGNPKRWYFDVQTGLLLRTETIGSTGQLIRREDYEDYRAVDGLQIPFLVKRTESDFETIVEFEEIRHNIAIDDAKFGKPAGRLSGGKVR